MGARFRRHLSSEAIDYKENPTLYNDGEYYKRDHLQAWGIFSITSWSSMKLGLQMRRNQSAHQRLGTQAKSGVESAYGQLYFNVIKQDNVFLKASALFLKKLYTNEPLIAGDYQRNFVLGDEGYVLGVGGHLDWKFRPLWRIRLDGIFHSPENLSQEVFYQFSLMRQWRLLSLGVGFYGLVSFQNDEYTNFPHRKPLYNKGHTEMINSINREYFWGKIFGNIRWNERFETGLFFERGIQGRSTDLGNRFGINLLFRMKKIQNKEEESNQRINKNISLKKGDGVEATVQVVSQNEKFIKVDKGESGKIKEGMRFYIFKSDFIGKRNLIGEAVCYKSSKGEAILKVIKKIKNESILVGYRVSEVPNGPAL